MVVKINFKPVAESVSKLFEKRKVYTKIKPNVGMEESKAYTKMKLKPSSPTTDVFKSGFSIPTTPVTKENAEKFLTNLNTSKYGKPSSIPNDIPEAIDFSFGKPDISGVKTIEIKDTKGQIVRIYKSATDGKTPRTIKIIDPSTGNNIKIIKYNSYGKISNICDIDPITRREIKRTIFWETGKLKGIASKNETGKEIVVKYLENGTNIDYVTNAGVAIYKH